MPGCVLSSRPFILQCSATKSPASLVTAQRWAPQRRPRGCKTTLPCLHYVHKAGDRQQREILSDRKLCSVSRQGQAIRGHCHCGATQSSPHQGCTSAMDDSRLRPLRSCQHVARMCRLSSSHATCRPPCATLSESDTAHARRNICISSGVRHEQVRGSGRLPDRHASACEGRERGRHSCQAPGALPRL